MTRYANRGASFESLIEFANNQYAAKRIALIQKVATPWKVIRQGKKIISAFPEKKSTVDFIGVSMGRAIAFDAKSTLETRFPLSNIEQHQIDFLERWQRQNGIAFFLIEFAKLHEVYYLSFDEVKTWWDGMENGRKSIPYEYFRMCRRVEQGRVVLDYLAEIEGRGYVETKGRDQEIHRAGTSLLP